MDPDDEGFADDPESQDMEVTDASANLPPDMEEDELLQGSKPTVHFLVNPEEPEHEYTKEQMEEVMKSEPYRRKIATCHLCQLCWEDGKCSEECQECGGFALSRPCPVCKGRCQSVWTRNVRLSHTFHKAHWEGECGLSERLQEPYRLQAFTDSSEDALAEALQDVSAH